MLHLDFTKRETLQRMAELPHYGWAEALVRRIDPLWKVRPEEPVAFRVTVERGSDGCNKCDGECCGDVGDLERKQITVEAWDDESARAAAEEQMRAATGLLDWEAMEATPKVTSATVPDKYLKWFDA